MLFPFQVLSDTGAVTLRRLTLEDFSVDSDSSMDQQRVIGRLLQGPSTELS